MNDSETETCNMEGCSEMNSSCRIQGAVANQGRQSPWEFIISKKVRNFNVTAGESCIQIGESAGILPRATIPRLTEEIRYRVDKLTIFVQRLDWKYPGAVLEESECQRTAVLPA